jgi:Flp pilus assembly secretin CpaC
MTAGIPVEVLGQRAAEQRQQLHNTVVELRQTVHEQLGVKRNVRNHWGPVAGVLAIAGLALGYALTGIFTSD